MSTITPGTIAHTVRPIAAPKPFTVADQIPADIQRVLLGVTS